MLTTILARLREPSSYAGLAALLGVVGIQIAPETWTLAVQAVTAVAGLAAILLGENKPSA